MACEVDSLAAKDQVTQRSEEVLHVDMPEAIPPPDISMAATAAHTDGERAPM